MFTKATTVAQAKADCVILLGIYLNIQTKWLYFITCSTPELGMLNLGIWAHYKCVIILYSYMKVNSTLLFNISPTSLQSWGLIQSYIHNFATLFSIHWHYSRSICADIITFSLTRILLSHNRKMLSKSRIIRLIFCLCIEDIVLENR